MKSFKIYTHPAGRVEAVKQGWSWPAFLFGAFWALFKKLWAIGIGLLVIAIIWGIISAQLHSHAVDLLGNLVGIVIGVFFGIYGNGWRESNLSSRGYVAGGVVEAANGESAVAAHANGNPGPPPTPTTTRQF
ncbi:MAG TPA: DUF2628 domain-containing protein [Oleiagrimonas sp.]|nr:DUF2628 domain-containing protein [Oleiagrimonas sp.]